MSYVYQNITIGQRIDVANNGRVITTAKGDIITDNGTQSARLPVGTNGQALVANSATTTGLEWQAITPASIGLGAGDGLVLTGNTLNVGGSSTILSAPDSLSVNSSAIANQVLLSSGTAGTAASYGAVPLNNSSAVTGILGIANGGTGTTSFTSSRVIASNAGGTALTATTIDPATLVTTTSTSTLTNKSLTIPVITGSINDANSNEIIILNPAASAVNEITVSNAATGTAPSITATGGDTNIGLNIAAKGTGRVNISGISYPNADGANGQVLSTNGAGVLSFVNTPTFTAATATTTDATVTTLTNLTIATVNNTAYMVEAKILAKQPTTANVASFIIKATFINNSSTLSRIGIETMYVPVATVWSANITNSGTNIIVTVTGAASTTVGWTAQLNTISITN